MSGGGGPGLGPIDVIDELTSRGEAVVPEVVRWIRDRLLRGAAASTPSITTRLPFPYHWIPGPIRIRMRDALLARSLRRLPRRPRFPGYYAENGLDAVGSLVSAGDGPAWCWPNGRRCALMLSHDVDTGSEHAGIGALADMARQRGLRSTFMFVGGHIERYVDLCHTLLADGFEVGLHDVVHDNRIAFLQADRVVDRLRPWLDRWQASLAIGGFRSPSWYASVAMWRGLSRAGLAYDSSVQDTNMMQEADRNVGAATYYPYLVGDLVVLPCTIPFDELPWALGVERSATARFWRAKIDHVAATGGLIVLNAHPSRWFCGDSAGRKALRDCLEVVQRHAPWTGTGREIAAHVRAEAARGAMIECAGEPTVAIPRHASAIPVGRPLANPVTDVWRA